MCTFLKSFSKSVGLLALFLTYTSHAQQSIARKWNEVLLDAIRKDFARPTVHARNLYHVSLAMYDAWAVYEEKPSTILLNHRWRNFYAPFSGVEIPTDDEKRMEAQQEAISYAAFRLLNYRFKDSPGKIFSQDIFTSLMVELDYDPTYA